MTADPQWGRACRAVFSLSEMLVSGNMAWKMFFELADAVSTIEAHASEELERALPAEDGLRQIIRGTMCLTEAHSGTNLGVLRTKAEPLGDGSYAVTEHQDLHRRAPASTT